MTLVVPFDGSELAKTALVRAAQFDAVFNRGVMAVSVIPRNNTSYARQKGWIDPGDSFDSQQIVETLRTSTENVAPDVFFKPLSVGRNAPAGTIANRLRKFARDQDASIVFIGSENAGRMVGSLSVGSSVASEQTYDTMIISQVQPSRITKLEAEVSTEIAITE